MGASRTSHSREAMSDLPGPAPKAHGPFSTSWRRCSCSFEAWMKNSQLAVGRPFGRIRHRGSPCPPATSFRAQAAAICSVMSRRVRALVRVCKPRQNCRYQDRGELEKCRQEGQPDKPGMLEGGERVLGLRHRDPKLPGTWILCASRSYFVGTGPDEPDRDGHSQQRKRHIGYITECFEYVHLVDRDRQRLAQRQRDQRDRGHVRALGAISQLRYEGRIEARVCADLAQ